MEGKKDGSEGDKSQIDFILTILLFMSSSKVCGVGGLRRFLFLKLSEVPIPIINLLLCLEHFKMFKVGGWVGGGVHSEFSVLL